MKLLLLAAAIQVAVPAPVPDVSAAKGKVHVYRYKQYNGRALEPSVYVNEVEVAKMDNGRFFTLELVPGKHMIRSNDRQSGVALDVKPGSEHYIRVDIAMGFMKGHGRLTLIMPEQGAVEVLKLAPLGDNKVRDRSYVKTAR